LLRAGEGSRKKGLTQRTRGPEKKGEGRRERKGTWMDRMRRMKTEERDRNPLPGGRGWGVMLWAQK
jgi:hypothetical protein